MTGTQIDPVSTSDYLIACAAIQGCASSLFDSAEKGISDETLAIWSDLRYIAHLLFTRRSLQLNPQEACKLGDLLNKCPPSEGRDYLFGLTFRREGAN